MFGDLIDMISAGFRPDSFLITTDHMHGKNETCAFPKQGCIPWRKSGVRHGQNRCRWVYTMEKQGKMVERFAIFYIPVSVAVCNICVSYGFCGLRSISVVNLFLAFLWGICKGLRIWCHKRALNWMFLSYFGAWVSQRPFWGVGFAVCGPIPSPRQGDRPGTYQIRARRCKYRCEDTSRTHKVIHTCACIYRTFANLSSVYLSLKSSQFFQFIHTQLSKSFTQHSRFCSFGHVKYFCRSYTMMANMQSGLKFIVPMIKLLRWHMKLVDCLITASTGHFLHL